MNNINEVLGQLSKKIEQNKEFDYIDIRKETDNIIIMLNWERFIIKKSRINGIKFKYNAEKIAIEFGIIFNGASLDVPIYVKASEAYDLEIKLKKIL